MTWSLDHLTQVLMNYIGINSRQFEESVFGSEKEVGDRWPEAIYQLNDYLRRMNAFLIELHIILLKRKAHTLHHLTS